MKTLEQLIAETPSLAAPDNYAVRERQWRAPSVAEDEEIIFDEPGRVLSRTSPERPSDGVDCRSHYFRVTKPRFGFYKLRVKHGGGEDSLCLKYDKRIIEALAQLDSDSRYWMLFTFLDVKDKTKTDTADAVNGKWRKAAAQKRIKTRKVKDGVKVWIEPEIVTQPQPVAA
jgi:hypothetical protein